MNTSPATNINTARRQANCYAKAQEIIKNGYTFSKDADSDVIAVCKRGRLAASYWINMLSEGCDCPDAMKHPGTFCKHTMAWDILQAEEADEAAMWETICTRHDNEEGAHLDLIPLPSLTKDVVTAMKQDLKHVQADIAAQGERHTGYIHGQAQRDLEGRIENALLMIERYRQLPAPSAIGCASCWVCQLSNISRPSCFGEGCPNPVK